MATITKMPTTKRRVATHAEDHHLNLQRRLRERLGRDLRKAATPTEQIDIWATHRDEMFIRPGLEHGHGTGPGAAYHIGDAADLLLAASEAFRGVHDRPHKQQIDALAHAVGYRWMRGVQGVTEALRKHGASRAAVERFEAEREDFLASFTQYLNAAAVIHQHTRNADVVEHALRLFADECLEVAACMRTYSDAGAWFVEQPTEAALGLLDGHDRQRGAKREVVGRWR